MNDPFDPFAWFWTIMIALSIGWYTFLLFWLGIRGGHEIYRLTEVLSQPEKAQDSPGK